MKHTYRNPWFWLTLIVGSLILYFFLTVTCRPINKECLSETFGFFGAILLAAVMGQKVVYAVRRSVSNARYWLKVHFLKRQTIK